MVLHVSGGDVDHALKLLAQRLDDGQTDPLVTARYHGNLSRHVCGKGREGGRKRREQVSFRGVGYMGLVGYNRAG